jgi:hypothetical protein
MLTRDMPPAEPAELDADPVDEPGEEPVSDADFLRSLRADVAGVREGLVPSITQAQRPVLKDRPWSKRRRPRDRYGNRIG